MSVLHVAIDGACWWNERGFGRFTRELLAALAARAASQQIRYSLVLEGGADPRGALPEPPAGFTVTSAGTTPTAEATRGAGARTIRHMASMGRGLAATGADVVFFPAVYSWVPVPARSPTVVTVHDVIPELFPRLVFPSRRNEWLWRIKGALARRSAHRILTVSEASAREIAETLGVDPRRIDITTEAADPVFRPRDDRTRAAVSASLNVPDRPYLLYVGGFNAHKNVPRLLEAFSTTEGVNLVLVGDTTGRGFHDDVPALRAWLAARPRVAERVALPGWLPDDDLVHLYSHASALVLPSLAEGFGLPAVEAMACGCPVVCSDRTSLPEVVGDAGLLIDPLSVDSIARALTQVLGQPELAAGMRDRGLARAATFTWDLAAERTEASFRRALEAL